jgi:hypothetical protein
MVVYGTHRFGYVDQVPGVGAVATRFIHIMFIPLIPLGSQFVLEDDSGIAVGWSLKSVIVAYVRAALFWGAVASFVAIPMTFGITCVTALPCTLGYLVLPLLVRKAGAARAEALRSQFAAYVH